MVTDSWITSPTPAASAAPATAAEPSPRTRSFSRRALADRNRDIGGIAVARLTTAYWPANVSARAGQCAHRVPGTDERRDRMAADRAGAPCDEDPQGHRSRTLVSGDQPR